MVYLSQFRSMTLHPRVNHLEHVQYYINFATDSSLNHTAFVLDHPKDDPVETSTWIGQDEPRVSAETILIEPELYSSYNEKVKSSTNFVPISAYARTHKYTQFMCMFHFTQLMIYACVPVIIDFILELMLFDIFFTFFSFTNVILSS